MRSLRLYGPEDLRLIDEPVPQPAPGEALLRVRCVTVCHSDIHYFKYGRIGDTVSEEPLVLGHEFSAEVVQVTAGISHVTVGDLVAVEPAVSCGVCRYCREGNPNLCYHILFCGTPPLDGALREYMAYRGEFLFPLPEGFTVDDGALLEPLGVAIHAWDLAKGRVGERVAIVGCGPIGLLLVQLARIGGAAAVYAVEPLESRRRMAASYGAVPLAVDEAPSRILEDTEGHGVDVAIEVAGTLPAQEEAVQLVKRGGTVVLVGIPAEDKVLLPHHVARRKGLTIKMARRMKHTYPRAIELVRRGMVDFAGLITHRYPLEQAAEAYRLVESYADGVIKAAIYP